ILLKRALVIRHSLIDGPLSDLRAGQEEKGGDIVFVEIDGFLKRGLCASGIRISEFGLAKEKVHVAVVRNAGDLVLDATQGLLGLLVLEVYVDETSEGIGGGGIERESLGIGLRGFVEELFRH